MRSDGIPRTAIDYLQEHTKRLDRLERRQGAAVGTPGGGGGGGNTTYRQPEPPDPAVVQLKVGDIWIDSDDNNNAYWWTGTQWLPLGWGSQDGGGPIVEPPTGSPTPTVTGGIGSLFISWPATGAEQALVSVYVSTINPPTAVIDNLVGTVYNSGPGLLVIRTLANGVPLVSGVIYYVLIRVSNPSGIAPVSTIVSGTPSKVTSPDLAVGSITADNLLANNAIVNAMEAAGINANWINAGEINSERLSVGSTSPGSMAINGNMEDPAVTNTGSLDPTGFAGWSLALGEGVGSSISVETFAPISGTRSMNVTVPPDSDGPRVIETKSFPVTGGYAWKLQALIRADRTLDRSTIGGAMATLVLHSSSAGDPANPQSGTTIIWTEVTQTELLFGNVVFSLQGFVTIPLGHRRAKLAIKLGSAPDGAPWLATIDEVIASPTSTSFQVVNPVNSEIVASFSTEGDLLAHDIDYSGTLNITDATYLGESLFERFARVSGALIAWGSMTPAAVNITNVGLGVMSMNLYMQSPRAVVMNLLGTADGNSTNMRFDVNVFYTYSATDQPADATIASPLMKSFAYNTPGDVGNNLTFSPACMLNLEAGYYNFLIGIRTLNSTSTTRPLKEWQAWFNDVGPFAGDQNKAYIPGGTPPNGGAQYSQLYNAVDTRWYDEARNMQGGSSDPIKWGDSGDGNGNRVAAIWFDDAKIRRDLAGPTSIVKAELYLFCYNGGDDHTAVVGFHNDSSVRNIWSNIVGRNLDAFRRPGWTEGTGKWIDLGVDLAGWKNGNRRGIILGPGPNNSNRFAFGCYGVPPAKRPVLRITYRR